MLQQILASSDQHLLAAGVIIGGVKAIFVAIGSIIAAVICAMVAKTRATVHFCLGFSDCCSASSP